MVKVDGEVVGGERERERESVKERESRQTCSSYGTCSALSVVVKYVQGKRKKKKQRLRPIRGTLTSSRIPQVNRRWS